MQRSPSTPRRAAAPIPATTARRIRLRALAVSAACCLAACSGRESAAPPPAPVAAGASAAAEPPVADRWLGRWNGPEGTFLELAGGQGRYRVTIRNLDGPRSFDGQAGASGITFERDGVRETIRATGGAETGMKWLAEKSDCLTVRAGEGYCRD